MRKAEIDLAVLRTVHAAAVALARSPEPALPTGSGSTTLRATRAYIEARLAFLGEATDLVTLLDPIARVSTRTVWRRHFHNGHTLAADGVLVEAGEGPTGAPRYRLAKGGN